MGRLTAQKDVGTLLRAIPTVRARHPGTRWVIVGTGDQALALRLLATQLGLGDQVVFAGEIAYADTPQYFAACDLFVLPSIYEGSARVLALAAAAAKPIIATDVSGTSDLVRDGETGLLTPVGDPLALAERVSRLLDEPDRSVSMGRAAQARVSAIYDEQRILSGFRELWLTTARMRKAGA
jgi:glycosyltransferase involved in cell wall biosynthesis